MTQHEGLSERLRIEPTASQYLSLSDLIASLVEDRKNAADALESQSREIAALKERVEGLGKDAERTANNRDMWKAQCSRQAEELGRLRSNGVDSGHSYRCTACANPYTPTIGESEDCPQCGWDGRGTYAGKAMDAAIAAKGGA